jgi:UDP-N-acetylglucosamine 3-dehydrogenase
MTLKVGLIGMGSMGRNHARVLDALDGVELAAVADPSPAAKAHTERRTHATWYPSHEALFDGASVDAVVIATPTATHHQVATATIERGLPVLVEKPLAATAAEAGDLIRRADARGVLLSVGHVERFNPAIVELKMRLARHELGKIFQVQARRQSPLPERISDVGVTVDLATHDIDLMRYLLEGEPASVYARTARRVHGKHEDLLVAVLTFGDGTIATVEVNWLTPTKIRELSVIGERGMFVVHQLAQELTFYANQSSQPATEDWNELAVLVGVSEGDVTRYAIPNEEPLLLELRNFTRACRGLEQSMVTAHDGLRALEIAEQLTATAD